MQAPPPSLSMGAANSHHADFGPPAVYQIEQVNHGSLLLKTQRMFVSPCHPATPSPLGVRRRRRTVTQVYQDNILQGLIREAFTNNYDLRIAVARVGQARALAMQARSRFVPSVDYNRAVSRGRNDLFASTFPNNRATSASAIATPNATC